MHTPILLLIFNRLDYTQKVFDRIREVQPQRLYVAADGPRKSNPKDTELCKQVREIINQVDWPCEVKTLFREENLGCKEAVSSAITWFFEHEEMGIILEDDILPDLSFFTYCEELLIKYKDDTRINHIAGFSPDSYPKKDYQDYWFGNAMSCWGWATWRRSWAYYSKNKDRIETFLQYEISNVLQDKVISDCVKQALSMFCSNTHSWDWVYTACLMMENSLCINPSVNLIRNLDANFKSYQLNCPLKHPEFIIPDNQYINKLSKRKGHLVFRYYFKKIIPHKVLMIISKILRALTPSRKLRNIIRKIDEI